MTSTEPNQVDNQQAAIKLKKDGTPDRRSKNGKKRKYQTPEEAKAAKDRQTAESIHRRYGQFKDIYLHYLQQGVDLLSAYQQRKNIAVL